MFLPFTTLYPTRSTGRDGHTEGRGEVYILDLTRLMTGTGRYTKTRGGEGFPLLAMMTFVCPLQRTHTLHTALFPF